MRYIVERCATQSGPAERSILAVYRTCLGRFFNRPNCKQPDTGENADLTPFVDSESYRSRQER